MSKKAVLIVACLMAGAAPAMAQNAVCTEPAAPAAVDGNTATQPQLVAAIAQVKDFLAKSDTYQTCLSDNLSAQQAAAIKNNTVFDVSLKDAMLAKVAANQAEKDRVGKDINGAIAAFKQKSAAK